jgi:dTDP-4-dehydrorhamnose reductase
MVQPVILCTGGSGQLGTALQAMAQARGLNLTAVSRPEFDFERPASIDACFAVARPGLVINAAAYTAVDAAESNESAARASNQTGPETLALLCAGAKIPFIHISTDYVFDGTKGAPYLETDPTSPTGIYGLTKRDGERAVLAACPNSIILRTSWVYSAHGKNFARTMLNAARKTNALRVVADQRGTPTAADDLAATVLNIITKWKESGWHESYKGIYHATGTGETTWYDFARAIFESAKSCGLTPPSVTPISTADWPTPAKRPSDSRLDCAKLERVFQERLPNWTASLPAIVHEIMTRLTAPENPP